MIEQEEEEEEEYDLYVLGSEKMTLMAQIFFFT